MTDPGRIAVAGDWHGNTRWAVHAIEEAAKALEGEDSKELLHLGDFLPTYYYDPGRITEERRLELVHQYLSSLDAVLDRNDMTLMFVDGNHEDWEYLRCSDARWRGGMPAELAKPHAVPLGSVPPARIYWLQRGHRWQWHGREWLAFGGAVSPNKVYLTENWNWWPDEAVTAEQVTAAAAAGPASVVVAHDAPAEVHGLGMLEPPRSWRQEDLDASDVNRGRLSQLASAVRPGYWMHGHHHTGYDKGVNQPWGLMRVTGLAMDGDPLNWLVLDVRTLEWEMPAR